VISYYCPECAINWFPYQARAACPVCKHGTIIRQEDASAEACELYRVACLRREGGDTIAFDPVLDTVGLSAEIKALPTFMGERRWAA